MHGQGSGRERVFGGSVMRIQNDDCGDQLACFWASSSAMAMSVALAGKSTLNGWSSGARARGTLSQDHHDGAAIERLFVDLSSTRMPRAASDVLDLDATDDPLHGDQEGRSSRLYDCYATCRFMSSAAAISGRQAAALDIDGARGRRGDGAHIQQSARAGRGWIVLRATPARPRGLDGLVRGQRGRLRVRSGAHARLEARIADALARRDDVAGERGQPRGYIATSNGRPRRAGRAAAG